MLGCLIGGGVSVEVVRCVVVVNQLSMLISLAAVSLHTISSSCFISNTHTLSGYEFH